jgi:hypothetical protein
VHLLNQALPEFFTAQRRRKDHANVGEFSQVLHSFEETFDAIKKNKGGTKEKMESATVVSAYLASWRRNFYGCSWALHLTC